MAVGALRADSLRLVNAGAVPARHVMPLGNTAAAEEIDPRWVLAVAAARMLEGGRAAILPNGSRERVLRLASSLGLRAFDAALVIAIVQDAARRGEPLGGAVAERLRMVRASSGLAHGGSTSAWIASVAAAASMFAAMIAWLLR
jgi:hypothetical protein